MNIFELEQDNSNRVLALAQFLLGRATDTSAVKKIHTDAFLKMATHMGIPLTRDQLINLADRPPLNQIIDNIENDVVVFKGADGAATQTQKTQTQQQNTVAQMARRAAGI